MPSSDAMLIIPSQKGCVELEWVQEKYNKGHKKLSQKLKNGNCVPQEGDEKNGAH